MADIVFMYDESGSGSTDVRDWLSSMIAGTQAANFQDGLHYALNTTNDIDVRYGLVGYGADDFFSHSHPADQNMSKTIYERLFSDGDHVDDIEAAIATLADSGGWEDGWDAMEHAIAEFPFRDGAVGVLVLMQNGEARVNYNGTLTREGVRAALASKNALLNSIVIGAGTDQSVFDLSPYSINTGDFANRRILGVESDGADNIYDGQHDYHLINATTSATVTPDKQTRSDALQVTYLGSNNGGSGMVASGKSILIGPSLTEGLGPTTVVPYRAKSIPFNPIDMSTGTTSISNGDQIILPFPTDNRFRFFDTEQLDIYVHNSGTITFDAANDPSDGNAELTLGSDIFNPRPEFPIIAALWEEIVPAAGGGIKYKQANVDGVSGNELVIQWTNFEYVLQDGVRHPITFQAVLFADGRIQFNYLDIDGLSDGSPHGPETADQTGGINATVGIWNGSATPITLPAGKIVPGPHNLFGTAFASDGAIVSDTNDSYIRMAWDTGGAAWDLGSNLFDDTENEPTPYGAALRDGLKTSLAAQIARQTSVGKVFRSDAVLKAIDYGALTNLLEGFEADPDAATLDSTNRLTTTTSIDTLSNSIPFIPSSSTTKVSQVFQSARKATQLNQSLNLSITTLDGATSLADGTYIVELLFSAIPDNTYSGREAFDVVVEGKRLLNDYSPAADRARVVDDTFDVLDAQPAGFDFGEFTTLAGIVKRFKVDVTSGLQINLVPSTPGQFETILPPSIAGLRILRADSPRAVDVTLKGSTWSPNVSYSYAQVVPQRNQLKPEYHSGVNRIEVKFNEHVVRADGTSLTGATSLFMLHYTQAGANYPTDDETVQSLNPSSVTYDEPTRTATLTFNSVLGQRNKYRLEVSDDIRTPAGNALDGEWANSFGSTSTINGHNVYTADDPSNDPLGVFLVSGDGTAGGDFHFKFAILPGDYNQDGVVDGTDDNAGIIQDGDGDGIIGDSGDIAIVTANSGQRLMLRDKVGPDANRGDYNDDEIVNMDDYRLWKATYGMTTGTRPADGNGDGTVNAADYTIYRNNSGDVSAWFGSSSGSGTAVVEVIFNAAPRIINVTISGSASTHDPFSFDDPQDDQADFDGSGIQLRTVPVGGADTI
ncbi:MAG: hypothetical protein WD669_10295, partial [Pirellulales bacterium]